MEDHVEKVIMFATQPKDLYDPVLHIVFVMGDMLEKKISTIITHS
jgi:hypothetical protein